MWGIRQVGGALIPIVFLVLNRGITSKGKMCCRCGTPGRSGGDGAGGERCALGVPRPAQRVPGRHRQHLRRQPPVRSYIWRRNVLCYLPDISRLADAVRVGVKHNATRSGRQHIPSLCGLLAYGPVHAHRQDAERAYTRPAGWLISACWDATCHIASTSTMQVLRGGSGARAAGDAGRPDRGGDLAARRRRLRCWLDVKPAAGVCNR